MGPAVALAGVKIRTGNIITTGERVLSGLMLRSGSRHLIFDNTGRLRQGPIPAIGYRISFGAVNVLFAVAPPASPPPSLYPRAVQEAEDPPCYLTARSRRIDRPVSCEVC
jgi:hypothetical protein